MAIGGMGHPRVGFHFPPTGVDFTIIPSGPLPATPPAGYPAMLRVLGHPSAACDGVTRRDLLQAGSLALLAPAAGGAATAATAKNAPAKAVILIDLFGGPSHIDTFDPKPDTPAEIRGEFGSIATALPGVRVSDQVPLLAKRLDRTCLIRTLTHRYNSHNPYCVMTGFDGGNDREDYFAKPSNHPSMGSVCRYAGLGRPGIPPYVVLPAYPGYSQGLRRAGPYGGYLGGQYNPLFSSIDPTWNRPPGEGMKDFYNPKVVAFGDPQLPSLSSEMTLDMLDRRRTLLRQFDEQSTRFDTTPQFAVMAKRQREAFEVLTSPASRGAFDLGREPDRNRDRYGRDVFGASVLLARRLVEAGVTFVTVHTEARPSGHWDTHDNNFAMLREYLLPFLDRAVSALIDDLDARGLLESTLVVVMGDMGRTPRVNKRAGRDHWPQCGFALLAGGGTKRGHVHGSSDRTAAYPKDLPVTSGDLVATVYRLLGLDPEMTVPDLAARPNHVSHGGRPVEGVMA
jgi:hypothetical protein